MKKNQDALFQDRVDELLLLEERAGRRIETLVALIKTHQEKSDTKEEALCTKLERVHNSLAKMNAASEQVGDYVSYSERHALRTAKLFLGTVIACALFIAGTLWWSHHIMCGLAQDKADLAALDIKLKHTPVLVDFKGKTYVRVVPGSLTGFTRTSGRAAPGEYARLWHAR